MQELSNKEKKEIIHNNILNLYNITGKNMDFVTYKKYYSIPANMYAINEIFGTTWTQILKKLKIIHKPATTDYLLEKILNFYKLYGYRPTPTDFDNSTHYPITYLYYYYFGSWNNALELIGFEPIERSRLPEHLKNKSNCEISNIIINNLLALNDKTNGNFTFETYNICYPYPKEINQFEEIFGLTWNELLFDMGLTNENNKIAETTTKNLGKKQKQVVNNILELSKKTNREITFEFYKKHYLYPFNLKNVHNLFGISWGQLIKLLNIGNNTVRSYKYSYDLRRFIIENIFELESKTNQTISFNLYRNNYQYPRKCATIVKLFGLTWSEILEKLYVDENKIPKNSTNFSTTKSPTNETNSTKYSKKELLNIIVEFYNTYKRLPYASEFNNNPHYPRIQLYKTIFGGWETAIKQAGFDPETMYIPEKFRNKSYEESIELIKNNIIELNEKTGGNFSFETYKTYYQYPNTIGIFKKITGTTWTNMLAELKICRDRANVEYNYSSEYLINKILEFYKINNKVPLAKDLDHDPYYPESKIYIKRFGKWSEALRNAGFEPANRRLPGEFKYKTNEQIKQIIKHNILELNEKTNGNFTFETYKKHYPYPQGKYQVLYLFGCTWNQLVSELEK